MELIAHYLQNFNRLIVILLIVLVVSTYLINRYFKNKYPLDDTELWPLIPKSLMSPYERDAYTRLTRILSQDHFIFFQIPVSRFLDVKSGDNPNKWYPRLINVNADYVICSKDSNKFIAIVELVDSAKNDLQTMRVSQKLGIALESADIPHLQWDVKSLPNDRAIAQSFMHITPHKEPLSIIAGSA